MRKAHLERAVEKLIFKFQGSHLFYNTADTADTADTVNMDASLLKPTLHVEVQLKSNPPQNASAVFGEIAAEVKQYLLEKEHSVRVGATLLLGIEDIKHACHVQSIAIADYTGPAPLEDHHLVSHVLLDIVAYVLKLDEEARPRRRISQPDDQDNAPQARVISLPNMKLKDEWSSLIYDDCLPSQLLRYLTRMLGIMKQPGLNLSTFNWNRLCLLHGPPGSGKSTLCRALAQKLSIRLSGMFPQSVLVEINTNSMLSKYFGESGKIIGNLFEKIYATAQTPTTLVCVVMDEVETIAGSREKAAAGNECSDNVRATNQLLTALDRLKMLPNVIVLSTSNLIDAIDPAFLDRVDIKQFVPSPSPRAIYNILRSCLNELVQNSLIDTMAVEDSPDSIEKMEDLSDRTEMEKSVLIDVEIAEFSEMYLNYALYEQSPASRVWNLAQKCEGFSGRTLRRLPILGMAMYTWGGDCSLTAAVSALELAVEQELKAKQGKLADVKDEPGSF